MNVLLLNYEYPPVGGGGGHVSHQLAKELVKMEHNVDVLTMSYRNAQSFEQKDGVNIHRVPSIRAQKGMCQPHEMAIYVLSALVFALRLQKKKKYDLCHTHFIIPTGFTAFLLNKISGLPYIITAHGSDVPGHNPLKFSTQHKFLKPLWNVITKNASAIVSPSENLKRTILKAGGALDVTIIPNGFHPEKFNPEKEKEKIILMAGRLLKFKGYQYVLKAVKNMDLKGYKVIIAGDGTYKPYLKEITKEIEPGKVKFLGWVHPDILQRLYEKASIFVLASECESFGLVLLEAMSAGCAVVTTNIETCSEIVDDAGIVVPLHDVEAIKNALSTLIDNKNLMYHLKEKGVKRVKNHYHWRDIAKQYDSILSEVRRPT